MRERSAGPPGELRCYAFPGSAIQIIRPQNRGPLNTHTHTHTPPEFNRGRRNERRFNEDFAGKLSELRKGPSKKAVGPAPDHGAYQNMADSTATFLRPPHKNDAYSCVLVHMYVDREMDGHPSRGPDFWNSPQDRNAAMNDAATVVGWRLSRRSLQVHGSTYERSKNQDLRYLRFKVWRATTTSTHVLRERCR